MKSNVVGELNIKNKNIILLEGVKGDVISISENKKSLLLKKENGENQEVHFDSYNVGKLNEKFISSYHLYDKDKGLIAKDSIIISSGEKFFNKEMIESFFEIIHSPKRTKEYLTGIISLVLFSICMFLYLSDALKFSYGFKELFHIKELLFTGILLFAINMLLVKNNNGIIKDALNSFYKKATTKEIPDKIATIDLSLSKELNMSGKSFIMEESKSLFFKTSKLVTETHDVVVTEKEYVSSDYNPATNTETITYRERDRILSSSNSSYYALNIDGNRIKRLGVLSMDFKNEETLKYFNIIDNITGKIHQDKIVEKNGVFSYVSSINGNTETKNDLLKVFKIPFFNIPILTILFFVYFCYNYFKGDIHMAALTMLSYFALLVIKLIKKFYELKKQDELDYDMKVFCHKIRNNL